MIGYNTHTGGAGGFNVEIPINYTDFDYGAADATDTIDLATLPTDCIVEVVSLVKVEGFDDSTDALTGATIKVGYDDSGSDSADDDAFITAAQVAEDNTEVSSVANTGDDLTSGAIKVIDDATARKLQAVFTPTPSTGAASDLNAGRYLVRARIVDLKA